MLPADDRYRLVEDEFLLTAQRFTKHLHRAEYSRLKARAKSQHALTISAIERPVVGPMSATARLRDAASKRSARQRKVLTRPRQAADGNAGDGDDGGDDDAPWVGTSLQGLMESPRKEARSISSYAPVVQPTTRVAAAARPTRRQARHSTSPPPPERRNVAATAADRSTFRADAPSRGSGVLDVVPPASTRDSARDRRDSVDAAGPAGADEEDATDDDDPFSINRRRMRREKSRARLRKNADREPPRKLSPDTIPSFL